VKNRTLNLIAVLGIVATTIATARIQPAATCYVYVLKAKNPEIAQQGPRPEDAPLVQAHIKYLRGLIEKGVCIVAGHTLNQDEGGFGIVIVKTYSSISAQEIMEHDPLVQAGILQGSVFPFDVAIAANAVGH